MQTEVIILKYFENPWVTCATPKFSTTTSDLNHIGVSGIGTQYTTCLDRSGVYSQKIPKNGTYLI